MRAGRLRETIQIQTSNDSKSVYGDNLQTWTTAATVRAEVKPISANEIETGGKNELRQVWQFTARYDSNIDNLNRIVWDGGNYAPFEVINKNARNKMIVIRAFKDE